MTDAAELNRWIEAASRREDGAAARLIDHFYPRVQAIVHRELEYDFRRQHRWILPLFSTRDVVHDVFADVVAGLDAATDFPDERAFVAYLSTMVRNRLLGAVRHHEAKKRDARRRIDGGNTAIAHLVPTDDAHAEPELAAQLAERAETLRQVLDEFPERHRALLNLRMVDGETFPAIAEKLGYASQETARQAFLDAQAKLLVKLRARGLQ